MRILRVTTAGLLEAARRNDPRPARRSGVRLSRTVPQGDEPATGVVGVVQLDLRKRRRDSGIAIEASSLIWLRSVTTSSSSVDRIS
jgi:hypothetical protein